MRCYLNLFLNFYLPKIGLEGFMIYKLYFKYDAERLLYISPIIGYRRFYDIQYAYSTPLYIVKIRF